MQVYISNSIDEKDWDNQLMKNRYANAFQMSINYKPYQLGFGSKRLFITVQNQSGKIVGQLAAIHHFKDLYFKNNLTNLLSSRIGSILSWHYGPIIHDNENYAEILMKIFETVEKYAKEQKVLAITGSTSVSLPDNSLPFQKMGYKYKKWETWIIDLNQDIDYIYKSLHNKTRYDIRKGEKNNLSFEVVKDKSALKSWFELKFPDQRRRNHILKKYSKFNDYSWDLLFKPSHEKMFLAKVNGKVISGIDNKIFNHNVCQNSVVNYSLRGLEGGSFLTWNTIKWSKENGYSYYDMAGSNPTPSDSKEKGIRYFKSKWKGTKYTVYLVSKILNKPKYAFYTGLNSPSKFSKKVKNLLSKK